MSILLAFKFLTILPVPLREEAPPEAMRRAVAYYPLVGAVLGLLLVGLDLLLGLVFPPVLRAALVLAAWVGLTGALHLDGFMDSCDGLLAPRSPGERLEILRDTHVGSFAVAGGVLLLLVQYGALAGLQGTPRLLALAGAPVLGRWAMALAVVRYPYARPGPGLGRLVKEGVGRRELLIASGLALVATVAAWRWLGLAALPITGGFVAALVRWIKTRIPGLTGDTYGAIGVLTETLWLLLAVAYVAVRA